MIVSHFDRLECFYIVTAVFKNKVNLRIVFGQGTNLKGVPIESIKEDYKNFLAAQYNKYEIDLEDAFDKTVEKYKIEIEFLKKELAWWESQKDLRGRKLSRELEIS